MTIVESSTYFDTILVRLLGLGTGGGEVPASILSSRKKCSSTNKKSVSFLLIKYSLANRSQEAGVRSLVDLNSAS